MGKKKPILHPYMGFSRGIGSEEGALLIFAFCAKQARQLGWPLVSCWTNGEWLDMAVRRIWDNTEWLRNKYLKSNKPCVIESPDVCPHCNVWGGEVYEDRCSECEDQFDD